VHQPGVRQAAVGEPATLGQRDQLLDVGAQLLRLGRGGLDLLVLDQRGGHVAQQGRAVARLALQLAAGNAVLHVRTPFVRRPCKVPRSRLPSGPQPSSVDEGPRQRRSCPTSQGLAVAGTCVSAAAKVRLHQNTSSARTPSISDRQRRRRSARDIPSARRIASAISSALCGLISSASVICSAAPAKRERISTPGSSGSCAATYSLATRFIPSRSGVTSPIRLARETPASISRG